MPSMSLSAIRIAKPLASGSFSSAPELKTFGARYGALVSFELFSTR